MKKKQHNLQIDRDNIKQSIANNGGNRIEQINSEIKSKNKEKDCRQRKLNMYNSLIEDLGLHSFDTLEAFQENGRQISILFQKIMDGENDIINSLIEKKFRSSFY